MKHPQVEERPEIKSDGESVQTDSPDLSEGRQSGVRLSTSARVTAGLAASTTLLGSVGCNLIQEQREAITGHIANGFAPLPRTAETTTAVHVLHRVAFGPGPGDIARVTQMGVKNFLEEQLADKLPENRVAEWRINALDLLQNEESSPDTLNVMADEQLLNEIQQAAILRAVYSSHQLREVLADFWTNHFNIYAIKNDERVLIPTDAEHVIRPNVLGSFRDMLIGSAHSPAMLTYLDNQQNRKGVANENYAREILELHTLGVDSGYSIKDIQEVARCFTGWHVKKGFGHGVFQFSGKDLPTLQNPNQGRYDGFEYIAGDHDEGAKYIPFLNLHITPNGGKKDADTVLEALIAHPATARFLARKLCRRFLGHTPPEIVERSANAYLKTQGDIRAMLRPVLLDALPDTQQTKPILKRPLEYLASALRAVGADTDGGVNVQKYLVDMGQPLYQWPMPDGFPEKASAWMGSLLPRWNFAMALASNRIEGTRTDIAGSLKSVGATTDEARLNTLIEGMLHQSATSQETAPVRSQLQQHIARAKKNSLPEPQILAEAAGLLLSSPTFQWR